MRFCPGGSDLSFIKLPGAQFNLVTLSRSLKPFEGDWSAGISVTLMLPGMELLLAVLHKRSTKSRRYQNDFRVERRR
jgi:hypothetical protein